MPSCPPAAHMFNFHYLFKAEVQVDCVFPYLSRSNALLTVQDPGRDDREADHCAPGNQLERRHEVRTGRDVHRGVRCRAWAATTGGPLYTSLFLSKLKGWTMPCRKIVFSLFTSFNLEASCYPSQPASPSVHSYNPPFCLFGPSPDPLNPSSPRGLPFASAF